MRTKAGQSTVDTWNKFSSVIDYNQLVWHKMDFEAAYSNLRWSDDLKVCWIHDEDDVALGMPMHEFFNPPKNGWIGIDLAQPATASIEPGTIEPEEPKKKQSILDLGRGLI